MRCLLGRGLDPAEVNESRSLEVLLGAVPLRDSDWQLGNYQILEEIGRGGMGVIYRARQRHSRRVVALKCILNYHADSAETLRRFRREAEAAASLDHPNILPIYEVSESEGLPYFSMKFAAGGSLLGAGALYREDPCRCARLIAKVAGAVHFAHTSGILHRDLKPGNILLDGHGEPMVSDFGLAKWLDRNVDVTRTLTIFGTPGFIAPEQAAGEKEKMSPPTDVYSLGAILFDLLTGRPPHLGEHAFAVMKESAEKLAPKLRSLRPELDRDLETICARCLEREPRARYQSAAEVENDLNRWVEGRPIMARPLLPSTRLWRWCRRNRRLAAAGAACFLLGMTVIGLIVRPFGIQKIESAGAAADTATAHFDPPEKSVAVIPFQNLSKEKADAYFAQGIQREIGTNLARCTGLKVSNITTWPTNVNSLAEIRKTGELLQVKYLIEGTVRRQSDEIEINVQLIDSTSGARRWSNRYARSVRDLLDVQGEIAQAVSHHLQVRLQATDEDKPTKDPRAYELFIKAKALDAEAPFKTNPAEDFSAAIDLLNEAVKRDPNFFLAFCELSYPHARMYFTGIDHTQRRLRLAENALSQASRLKPDAGELHRARGEINYLCYQDYSKARVELGIARESLPNDSRTLAMLGFIDRRQGRWDACIQNLTAAIDLDPRNFHVWTQLALTYQLQRHFLQMSQCLDNALAIVPEHNGARLMQSTIALARLGDTQPAHDAVLAVLAEDEKAAGQVAEYLFRVGLYERDVNTVAKALSIMSPKGVATDAIPFPRAWCEGVAAKMRGEVAEAHTAFLKAREQGARMLQGESNYPEAYCVLGMIDATLGRKDDAIREGRRAVELIPISKDAINGASAIIYLAKIYAWTGEKDLAFQQLQKAISVPSDINYGYLMLDPAWDPLRGDPRFDRIVAELAPK